jgi:hypothetical protein
MHRLKSVVACAIAVAGTLVPLEALSAPAALAVENGGLSAATSSSWQANATVWSMAYANHEIWVAGDFTSLRPPAAAAGTSEEPHSYLAALDSDTGAPVSFPVNHTFGLPSGATGLPLNKGIVGASPDGSVVYVGGNFATVDGKNRSHIVAFDTTTGAMTPFAPTINGKVSAIATAGNTVYVGGTFTKVDGQTRTDLAAVSATTGSLLPWSPAAPNNTVDALAATSDSSVVAIGGYFTSMGGSTTHNKAALVDGTTGGFLPFSADQGAVPVSSSSCVSNVKDVVISGGAAYWADEGTGGGCFDGTWAANLSDGSLKWVNRCLGATQTVAVVGNYLYKGSHIHDCRSTNTNGDPDNFPQVPADHNRHVTSERLDNGFLGPWYPNMNAGPNLGPRTMATDGSQLYVGGDFTMVDGKAQQGITRFTATTDYATPRPAVPTATVTNNGTVIVTAQAPLDLDDPDLTIEIFRDGGTTPISTTQVHSLFWQQPTVNFNDTGLAAGSSHTYTVQALETLGSGTSRMSVASAPVTIPTQGGHPHLRSRH